MPRPRSYSAQNLKKLCLETLHQNFDTLQHAAKRLTKSLINDLYDKRFELCPKFLFNQTLSDVLPPFPADLFLHATTKKVCDLNIFDRPIEEIVDKINRVCKNLRYIHLENDEINHILALTINNSQISQIYLRSNTCTDHHLFIIGQHCLQLQKLTLYGCNLITDAGINFLPEKLVDLFLPDQITVNGRLNALERLHHLKGLHCMNGYNNVIELLAKSLDDRVGNRTYKIEVLSFFLRWSKTSNIPQTIGTLFPKLRDICLYDDFTLGKEVAIFLEAINYNLLTKLSVKVSVDFVQIAAHLCPMLDDLFIQFVDDYQIIDDRYLAKPKNIPFKYLRKLDLLNQVSKLTADDFKLLLVNCQELESFTVFSYNQLSDQVIYDVLAANPMKHLKYLEITSCKPFTIESLCVLLKSLDSLKSIDIHCTHLSSEDEIKLRKLIEEMNWDLEFDWDNINQSTILVP